MPTEKREIRVTYTAIDGCRKVRTYRRLEFAQRFAQTHVGAYPELGSDYAVSGDGVGKITVQGATLAELFPELAPPERVGASFDFGEDWDDFSPETLARREAEKRRAAAEQAQKLADCRARPWVVQRSVPTYCGLTSAYTGAEVTVVSRFDSETAALDDRAVRANAEDADEDTTWSVRLETWEGDDWASGPRPSYSKGPLVLSAEAEWARQWDARRFAYGTPSDEDRALYPDALLPRG